MSSLSSYSPPPHGAQAEDGREQPVAWAALLALNQRHLLPTDAGQGGGAVMRLEDGLWADFGSALLRAEIALAALAIGRVLERAAVAAALEASDEAALDAVRGECVVAMRACLDVSTFARDGGESRGRDRARYARDDVAKMAAHGEGHCRTCSSCFAPFVWTFAEVLALDPHYCTDAGGRHQWLQVEARPSMRRCHVRPSRAASPSSP